MQIFSGLRHQITLLKEKLKKHNPTKNPKVYKEVLDALEAAEERYARERAKKQEKLKAKEEASKTEVEKEALTAPTTTAPGAATQTSTPTPQSTDTSPAPASEKTFNCALCGGMTFNDSAAYQQHMSYTHASDTMPTSPAQPAVVKADVITDKVEQDPKIAPGIMIPDSLKQKEKVVERVEQDPNIAPHIVSEEKTGPSFKLDDEVKPIRGSESTGKVMRWDGKPSDLVYVAWDSGPLSERDGFGGYYPHDLQLVAKEPVEVAAEAPAPVCSECVSMKQKHGDLKTNYEALLNDLKEERKIHYEQGNNAWVARLDQKIVDLEKKYEEKFPKESSSACSACGQKEAGAENASELTVMDHTPPRANSGPDAGGKDTHDEFQDEWAMPAGIELESKLPPKKQKELNALVQQAVYGYQINIMDMSKVSQAGEAAFISGQDVIAAVHAFLDSMVAAGRAQKTAALGTPVTEPIKIVVFKREFTATPVNGQKKFGGYDISDATGKKILNIKSKDSQPMTKEQLEFCAQIELTRGLKQAKLVEKIAFLEAGSKVYIIASDKSGKQVKFASMDHGVRGWAPASKFAFVAKEGEMRKHKDHIDNTYGHNGKEILVDCPNGSGNLVWLSMGELLPIQAPPATPESLNEDLGKDSTVEVKDDKVEMPKSEFVKEHEKLVKELEPIVEEHKEQGDELKEVKEALKTALPPVLPNQRGYLDNPVDKEARGCDQCAASMINGVFCHETGCPNARKEREEMEMESSLNKQGRVVHHKDGWHVLSEKGKNLGGPYKFKAEAVKRLRQVEYFKHHGVKTRPFSKIAEVLVDPYQALTNHITDMRSRMTQVQEKIQSNPVPKTAGENEADNSSIEVPELFEDLAQGIDLLETKLKGEDAPKGAEEIHESLEELENLLWEVEMKAGITPELPEHEKEELEHKEVVEKAEEMDKEASGRAHYHTCRKCEVKFGKECGCGHPKVNTDLCPKCSDSSKKEAANNEWPLCSVDGCKNKADSVGTEDSKRYCYTHSWGHKQKMKEAATVVPTAQNVQPTDDDNLEVSVVMPTSPPPPGQKWVFDTQFNKYVAMPESATPGKTI